MPVVKYQKYRDLDLGYLDARRSDIAYAEKPSVSKFGGDDTGSILRIFFVDQTMFETRNITLGDFTSAYGLSTLPEDPHIVINPLQLYNVREFIPKFFDPRHTRQSLEKSTVAEYKSILSLEGCWDDNLASAWRYMAVYCKTKHDDPAMQVMIGMQKDRRHIRNLAHCRQEAKDAPA